MFSAEPEVKTGARALHPTLRPIPPPTATVPPHPRPTENPGKRRRLCCSPGLAPNASTAGVLVKAASDPRVLRPCSAAQASPATRFSQQESWGVPHARRCPERLLLLVLRLGPLQRFLLASWTGPHSAAGGWHPTRVVRLRARLRVPATGQGRWHCPRPPSSSLGTCGHFSLPPPLYAPTGM